MLVAILFLSIVVIITILAIPPTDWTIIIFFNILLSGLIYLIAFKIFKSRKYPLLIVVLLFTVLSLLGFDLLDSVNTVLVLCLFVASLILLK
ncbi:hypothetical protein H3C65_01265 [Patescibacteria group bacterium]|nr:hypothetical protein [Patescibacteria group bacterium]